MENQPIKQKGVIGKVFSDSDNALYALNIIFEEDLSRVLAQQEHVILYITCEVNMNANNYLEAATTGTIKSLPPSHHTVKNWFEYSKELKAGRI